MCGIAGYIGSLEIDQDRLDHCRELMGRRGPDFSAAYEHVFGEQRVNLLFSRLSIIDLHERANQPFLDGSKVMVFNGELYNYLEVRSRLRDEGVEFHTESDTEVLLSVIARHGWQGLDACEGMWALAVYDEADGTLLLSRDRFGEKPLFVYRDSTGLFFGSEIKFIQCLLGKRLEVDFDHVYRYMVNGYRALYQHASSFFVGVEEIPAATVRIVARGREDSRAYWEPTLDPDDGMSYEDAVAGAREMVLRAVELRLRADVPLAFCMSGGVDSNSLIGVARRVFNYDVHGFTIVNSDERYEERAMVENSVDHLGLRHTAIPIDESDFLSNMTELVRYHDAPVYTISYYLHWLLMRSIGEHGYRISVSGSAADELFSGYYDHHLAYLAEVYAEPELFADSVAAWRRHVEPEVRNPFLKDPMRFVETPEFRDHIFVGAEEFAAYLRVPWSEPFTERRYTDLLLRNRMLNELFYESIPVILHEDDLNSMYFSIENRSPFLDRELFDFCAKIPTRHLIRDGAAKAVLRDAMEGIVPEGVRTNRRKVGFNAPVMSFLDVADPSVRAYLLDDSPVFDHVRKEKVEELIGKEELPNSESKFLFYFLNTKLFVEEFAC